MILALLFFAAIGFIFAYSDAVLFGGYAQPLAGKLGVPVQSIVAPYRRTQLLLQFTLYALSIALPFKTWFVFLGVPFHSAMVGFMVAHFCFGLDWVYFIFRKENYLTYDPIDWNKFTLPQILSYAFRRRWISGEELQWIGPTACIIGAVIAAVFA
jgi:hypothetical protein